MEKVKRYLYISLAFNVVALLVVAGVLVHLTHQEEAPPAAAPMVLTTDQFSAHVDKNEDGKMLYVTLGEESGLPFSQAVVTVAENTSLYTLNGTRIAIRPERVSGEVLVKFSTVEKIEGDTAHLQAEEILCSAD